jgi:hypothetical protein
MDVQKQIVALIDEYRDRCLWFLRPDYFPKTPEESQRVLDLIVRYGDRAAFTRVNEIKAWLSRDSKGGN